MLQQLTKKTMTVKLQVGRQLHWMILRARKLDSMSNGIRPGIELEKSQMYSLKQISQLCKKVQS